MIADRVKETTTTTGTGPLTLGGPETGYQSCVAGIGDGNPGYYCIRLLALGEWEVFWGTVTDGSPDTLTREAVLQSSNADALVDFSAGTKEVFCIHPAEKTLYRDADGDMPGAESWDALQTFNAGIAIASGQNIAMAHGTFVGVSAGKVNILFDDSNNVIDIRNGDLRLIADEQKLYFGASQQLSIQFDGDDGVFTLTSGDFVFMGGNAGFGTATPGARVEIRGTGDSSQNLLNVLNLDGTGGVRIGTNAAGNGFLTIKSTGGAARFHLDTDGDSYFNPVSGNFGVGTNSPDRLVHAEVSDAVTAAVTYGLRLGHITSGTAAAGFGTGIEFELEDDGGGMNVSSRINTTWLSAVAGSERGLLTFQVLKANGSFANVLTLAAYASDLAMGFFGSTQVQQAHIVDAVTDAAQAAGDPPTKAEFDALVAKFNANWAKFNTLKADIQGYGLLKAS